jgi:hypothetical protein
LVFDFIGPGTGAFSGGVYRFDGLTFCTLPECKIWQLILPICLFALKER